MKISHDTIGNRNRDLLAFNAFPRPTARPRALKLSVLANNYTPTFLYDIAGLVTYELGTEYSDIYNKTFYAFLSNCKFHDTFRLKKSLPQNKSVFAAIYLFQGVERSKLKEIFPNSENTLFGLFLAYEGAGSII